MPTFLKILVSVAAVALAAGHQILPSVKIDTITLVLLAIAVLPWIIRYVKEFEIPGVVKITMPEAKAATDKLDEDNIVLVSPAELKLKGHAPTVVVSEDPDTSVDNLRSIAESDPNLAMVGFRIEIEKRIRRLAELNGMITERRGLHRQIRELNEAGILSGSATSGLLDLVGLANRAAHGDEVTPDAAQWVLDEGPRILRQLDVSSE